MRAIRGVIFDLGSTLFRFEGDWDGVIRDSRQAMVASLLSMGVPIDGVDFASAFSREMETNLRDRQQDYIERPAAMVLRKVLQDVVGDEVSADVIHRALRAMFEVSESHWILMSDAHEVLRELQADAFRLGVISNASDTDDVNRLIDSANLRDYFDPILISAEFGRRKPDPSLFKAVLQAWSMRPDEVVMIGDTLSHDILGAQKVGLRHIWFTAQADTALNRAFADRILPEEVASELRQVPDLIRRMSAG